jgi:hypothetical protein
VALAGFKKLCMSTEEEHILKGGIWDMQPAEFFPGRNFPGQSLVAHFFSFPLQA